MVGPDQHAKSCPTGLGGVVVVVVGSLPKSDAGEGDGGSSPILQTQGFPSDHGEKL